MEQSYKKALGDARKEISRLLQERDEIERRLARLQETANGLAALCEEEEAKEDLVAVIAGLAPSMMTSLTATIRHVLKTSRTELTAQEVRDRLLAAGVDLDKYAQQMVPIHNTLKRLESQRELSSGRNQQGQITYGWIGEQYGAAGMRSRLLNVTKEKK